ncbi:MAG: 2-dehydro-3-deoxygalactonokinase [Pseudomonadota bacterium]
MSAWIAVDWGTTQLRAWAMQGAEAMEHASSRDGMGQLAPDGFEPALLNLVEPWLSGRTRVVACGMVGARQGWIEATYQATPCAPVADDPVQVPTRDARLDVRILRGVKQEQPADVMRGEETQIAGFLAGHPGFDGVLCLPGTHSKWVQVSAGEIVSFRTFMTGEMFALLSTQSVLRHSVAADGWDDAAFNEALQETLSKPESLATKLFAIRARSLLQDADAAAARAQLSGLLIGAELAAARPYWLGQSVALIGAPGLSRAYAAALTAQGLDPVVEDGSAMTLAGLCAAYAQLSETA